jgi:hypothetical protein
MMMKREKLNNFDEYIGSFIKIAHPPFIPPPPIPVGYLRSSECWLIPEFSNISSGNKGVLVIRLHFTEVSRSSGQYLKIPVLCSVFYFFFRYSPILPIILKNASILNILGIESKIEYISV